MNKDITFINNIGLNISGNIMIPDNISNVSFIVFCHGFTSSKNSSIITVLRNKLFELGIGSFAFDFIGHGDSEGSISDFTAAKGVDDLEYAFKYLEQYNVIDFNSIGLFGRSIGGNVVLRYASKNSNIKCIALNAPASSLPNLLQNISDEDLLKWKRAVYASGFFGKENITLGYDFYDDLASHNIYEMAKDISCNCLIVHGDNDSTVSLEQSQKLKHSIGSNAILEIIDGANHRFELPEHSMKSIAVTVDFFKNNLMHI